jgi:salicylate---CoA ligase
MEVARYKTPELLLTVGELPLTKAGKVDKKALREIARHALMRPDAAEAR